MMGSGNYFFVCVLKLQQIHMSYSAKQKLVIAVQCVCVNTFSILLLECSNKTVQTLDSYLICLNNTHISKVYKFSGPCDQNLIFIHLAKYYWMKKYLWYRKKKMNLPKPVPTVLTGINFRPWRHDCPAREELHGTQSIFLSVLLKKTSNC